ncbi:MAG: response regulator [Nostoc sp.]|uniref:response regulator n=1 Tax=Nostoc sp. TaxID=1180 RepID=UPI002FFBD735
MTQISASYIQEMPLLLIVEDSNEDFEVLQRFLGRSTIAIAIQRCVNGEQALAFLSRTGSYVEAESAPRPGLIVLDLNLPGTDGREVLRRIKQDDNLKMIPVVVFTTSNNPKDIEVCYQYGVNSYIVKPINFAQLKRDIQMLVEYWFEVTTLPDYPKD